MSSIFNSILNWFRSLLFAKHLEVCVVGLQGAGKTSLVNLLSSGMFAEEMVPTVGFNMKLVKSGNTNIKMWDIGGQPRFRNMWERYCRGVSAVLFVVDSAIPIPATSKAPPSASAGGEAGTAGGDSDTAAADAWTIATEELHALIGRPALSGVPLLVLATKNDVQGAAAIDDVISVMHLDTIRDREVSAYSISSKSQANIDVTLRWLCARSPASAAR